jgi:hypothetical protein
MIRLIVVLTIAASTASAIASAGAALARYLTKRDGLAVFIGGMTLPSVIVLGLGYWLVTMQVDDAPPGMVILGNLVALAIVTPMSFLASRYTVRFLARNRRPDVD